MAWTKLENRFVNLPLILAGPILRHTTYDSVTVWVALTHARKVALKVYHQDNLQNPVIVGDRNTIAIGQNLHIVAVTAKGNPNSLQPGNLYYYKLEFTKISPDSASVGTLLTRGIVHKNQAPGDLLSYSSNQLPSFALPPDNIGELRLVHGSCRKTTSEGQEALDAVDKMLRNDWENPDQRPHQLFLTGDQIYADDLSSALLALLTNAGSVLLSGNENIEELLPEATLGKYQGRVIGVDDHQTGVKYEFKKINLPRPTFGIPSKIPPGTRKEVVLQLGGFTTVDGENHLIGFGEFLAMYLFILSDVIWPTGDGISDPQDLNFYKDPQDLPGYFELFPNMGQNPSGSFNERRKFEKEHQENYTQNLKYLINFKASLPKVRRALANIPTYMVFDDHEITDDWFLTRSNSKDMISKPLGRRIIQNGLLAYAICQGWGNKPDEFVDDQPGETLLNTAKEWIASDMRDEIGEPAKEKAIANLLGLPFTESQKGQFINALETEPLGKIRRNYEDTGAALNWHFHYQWHNHELIALDSRNWRGFPQGEHSRPLQLNEEGLIAQVPLNPPKAITIFIAPTNLLAIPFFHLGEQSYGKLALYLKGIKSKDLGGKFPYNPDLFDSWEGQTDIFEKLLARLATRGNNPSHRSRLILLSGDVHFGWTGRLQYAAKKPLTTPPLVDTSGQKWEFVMAHLTSSALSNQLPLWRYLFHYTGYVPGDHFPSPHIWFGWRDPKTTGLTPEIIENHASWDEKLSFRPWMVEQEPAMLRLKSDTAENIPAPDWNYRFDYIRGQRQQASNSSTILSLADPPSLRTLGAAMRNHRQYAEQLGPGTEIIAHNNLGEVTFHWEANTTLTQAINTNTPDVLAEVLVAGVAGFPEPPFEIGIGNESMTVYGIERSQNKLLKVQRQLPRINQTHNLNTPVTLRKQALHKTWWRTESDAHPDHEIKVQTIFAVSLEFTHPEYPLPQR